MSLNPFSLFGLVAALDDRNIQAHLTGTVDDCAVCATVSGPNTPCPAARTAEITDAAPRPLAIIEIVDQLGETCPINAWYKQRPQEHRYRLPWCVRRPAPRRRPRCEDPPR